MITSEFRFGIYSKCIQCLQNVTWTKPRYIRLINTLHVRTLHITISLCLMDATLMVLFTCLDMSVYWAFQTFHSLRKATSIGCGYAPADCKGWQLSHLITESNELLWPILKSRQPLGRTLYFSDTALWLYSVNHLQVSFHSRLSFPVKNNRLCSLSKTTYCFHRNVLKIRSE